MEDLTMILDDVKQKIDSYLDNVTAEDLLKKFTEKYGMSEYDMKDIEDMPDKQLVDNAHIA